MQIIIIICVWYILRNHCSLKKFQDSTETIFALVSFNKKRQKYDTNSVWVTKKCHLWYYTRFLCIYVGIYNMGLGLIGTLTLRSNLTINFLIFFSTNNKDWPELISLAIYLKVASIAWLPNINIECVCIIVHKQNF